MFQMDSSSSHKHISVSKKIHISLDLCFLFTIYAFSLVRTFLYFVCTSRFMQFRNRVSCEWKEIL